MVIAILSLLVAAFATEADAAVITLICKGRYTVCPQDTPSLCGEDYTVTLEMDTTKNLYNGNPAQFTKNSIVRQDVGYPNRGSRSEINRLTGEYELDIRGTNHMEVKGVCNVAPANKF
jgi:hypothetical protein